jgi:D-xylose transport system substrate-binding protein
MQRHVNRRVAAGVVAVLALVGCAGATRTEAPARKAKIGVILPDSKSSARWETADRKYLESAFKAASVAYDIQNAQNDKTAFQNIADDMITNGVTVLMIVNLDSRTGRSVLARAKSQGVATIDYDRLTLGGSAAYYVSFDNVKVGELQGNGLVKCLADRKVSHPVVAELNGATTDNNATQFKAGYDSVLNPRYASGVYVKGPDESVPEWDNAQAAVMFEQMFTRNPTITGVIAANDGLGNAAISALKRHGLAGKVPVTGQDATVIGLQNVLVGDQCMTVYKAIRREAQAASQLAIALGTGQRKDTGQSIRDPDSGRIVPSVLLQPVAIYKDNLSDVVADGFVTKAELCTAALTALCAEVGIR